MSDNDINKHISIREAAILTGMCAQTLRKLGDQQKIKCYKTHSGQRKFDKMSLIEMVKTNSSLSNIVKQACKVNEINCIDENNHNDLEGNPDINKEYFFYDICNYKNEKIYIDDFMSNHSSINTINDIVKFVDVCLETKNSKLYILPSLYNNIREYAIFKRICDRSNNNIIVI